MPCAERPGASRSSTTATPRTARRRRLDDDSRREALCRSRVSQLSSSSRSVADCVSAVGFRAAHGLASCLGRRRRSGGAGRSTGEQGGRMRRARADAAGRRCDADRDLDDHRRRSRWLTPADSVNSTWRLPCRPPGEGDPVIDRRSAAGRSGSETPGFASSPRDEFAFIEHSGCRRHRVHSEIRGPSRRAGHFFETGESRQVIGVAAEGDRRSAGVGVRVSGGSTAIARGGAPRAGDYPVPFAIPATRRGPRPSG